MGLMLVLAVSLRAAVGIDDTYQQVIDEKGRPTGKMQAGDTMILRYSDETIKLKAGRVVSVEPVKGGVASAPARNEARPNARPADAPSASAGTKPSWTTDYKGALAAAEAQNRNVLLLFTGSDWCGWCMRLQKEILTTPQFARYAAENLVLVEVDFPRGKAQSPELKRNNAALSRVYSIQGYPTMVLLDSKGKQIGLFGYEEGGPEPFIRRLKAR